MDGSHPEHRRVKITTDTDVQSTSSSNLRHLAVLHPFTRQIDVLFPSSGTLEPALSKLSTRYIRDRVKLADLVDTSGTFADYYLQPQHTDAHSDDVWCIDPRGLLTIFVGKETYERLGLLGKRLPFKTHKDFFVIRLSLQKNVESVANQARRNEALKAWDARRERDGLGAWNVVYSTTDASITEPTSTTSQMCEVSCQVTKSDDVHIPSPSLRRRPPASQTNTAAPGSDRQTPTADDGDIEDWDTEMATLFEWVGLSSLGSQRCDE
ncbi:hypothetical protein DXG01_010196 [Tephrocybe rancida]|nr:hypothetical protein DXG01_010196 [Tephrocybe rancida]